MPRRIVLVVAVSLGGLPTCTPKVSEGTASPGPTKSSARAPGKQTVPTRGSEPEPEAPRGEPEPAAPEPGRLAGLTAAHNKIRQDLGIAPLTWSPELARYAQTWADKLKRDGCRLEHRPRSGKYAQKYGENLLSMTGVAPTAEQVVERWAVEVGDYDAKKDRCRKVCGHYTQIVWRRSERVGCAMAACGDTEVWVCNYDPPGNFLGQRPY